MLAQVQALVRVKERHDQLASKAAEAQRMSKRLQAAKQQMDMEMDLARRLQESFLPQSLPQLPRVQVGVRKLPGSRAALVEARDPTGERGRCTLERTRSGPRPQVGSISPCRVRWWR